MSSLLRSAFAIASWAVVLSGVVRAELVDVAAAGAASQATEWNGGQFPAGLAIDGNPSTFSHTDSTTAGNWWSVRLAAEHEVSRIELVMRADCCGGRLSGATLRLLDSEGDSVHDAIVSDPGQGNTAAFAIPAGLMVRTVRVGFENGATNPGAASTSLHLGEVRVLAEIDLLPDIAYFDAAPAGIGSGESSELSWQCDDAATVEIAGHGPVADSGSLVVSPAASEVYTLIATNAHGSRTRSVAVIVDDVLLAPRVTEFMADNANTIVRSDGSTPDWIELWNPNPVAIDLAGYRLTDDPQQPARFVFPPTLVAAGGYLVVDAADLPLDGVPATGFRLDQAADSYLAFADPGGAVLQSWTYPRQREDVSYGPDWLGADKYFLQPTPGEAAASGTVEGFVSDTVFSVDRGFYDAPQTVAIATETEGAAIYFTTDGSEPAPDNPRATLYSAPLDISETTVLRAAAYRDGYLPTDVDTQTYIFPADVPAQSTRPANFPQAWVPNLSGVVSAVPALSHFGMDPRIRASLPLRDRDGQFFDMTDVLLAIPTMSLVVDAGVLFDPATGLHVNARNRGRAWERPASIEFIDPLTGDALQANCGLRMHGGWNRYPEMLKKSFRLYFRTEYGDSKFEFPLFPDGATDRFDRLILRSGNGKAWPSPWRALSGGGNSLERNTYLRDQFVRDLQGEMSGDHVAGRFVHLYINGHYWGLYNPVERPDEHFASSHAGGEDEDYDVMKWIRGIGHQTAAGSDQSWNELVALARGGPASSATYNAIAQRLDLPHFADYMLLNFFVGNLDWVDNNVYAISDRARNGPYRFYCWDSEEVLLSPDRDSTDQFVNDTCTELHHALRANPEYRLLFADRAQKHLFNDGALTRARTDATLMRHVREVDRAIVGDSARWGNLLRPADPYDRADWLAEVANLRSNYLGSRVGTTLNQLRSDGLFPALAAPQFVPQRGGAVNSNFVLLLESPAGQGGTIYYTTDGSDPRMPGGAVSPAATAFNAVPQEEVVVAASIEWLYHDEGADFGSSELVAGHAAYGAANWKHPAYDDSAWQSGPAPLGYGGVSGITLQTIVDYGPDALNRHLTTYFRKRFTVTSAGRFTALRIRLLRDDGAVVYLNGHEAARSNFPAGTTTVSFDTLANNLSGTDEGEYVEIPVSPALLADGENVLAVELHQTSGNSSDLGFDLELAGDALEPGAGGLTFTGDTLVRARVRSGATWSALDEALYLLGDRAHDLHVSEIMYHPALPLPGEAEFLELANRGATTHLLHDLHITGGIQLDFAAAGLEELAPGERLVLVRDHAAFAQTHPSVTVAAAYEGALSNGGDTFSLEQNDGAVLWTLSYGDGPPWPEGTDGDGHSLTYAGGPPDQPASWRASTDAGGSPGTTDSIPFSGGSLLDYATAGVAVRFGPAGEPQFVIATRLGADDATTAAEWSHDLETWHGEDIARVRHVPLGDGLAEDIWQLAAPAGPRLFFRAVVRLR